MIPKIIKENGKVKIEGNFEFSKGDKLILVLDNKVVNDDIKECSKIKWTKDDAIKYYDQTFHKKK